MISRRIFAKALLLPTSLLASLGAAGQESGLRDIAASCGISFGSAVVDTVLNDIPAYAAAIAREAALLVPEAAGKWDALQPEPGRFDFSGLARILDFAATHRQSVRGHTLVWGLFIPSWVEEAAATPARAQSLIESHIAAVLAFTRGRITEWDVINEPVADPRRLPGGDLRDSIWLRMLGERYLDVAFRAAHAADPTLRLVLNEYGVEASGWRADEKRRRLLRLLRGLLDRGVPLHAVGVQAHMRLADGFSSSAFGGFLRELRRMRLDVLLTELDVIEPERMPLRDEDISARDAAAAERVHAVVTTALAEGCRTVLTWGLADPFSWLNAWPPGRRPDGAQVRALPLDNGFNRKPMWHAMARAFEGRCAARSGPSGER